MPSSFRSLSTTSSQHEGYTGKSSVCFIDNYATFNSFLCVRAFVNNLECCTVPVQQLSLLLQLSWLLPRDLQSSKNRYFLVHFVGELYWINIAWMKNRRIIAAVGQSVFNCISCTINCFNYELIVVLTQILFVFTFLFCCREVSSNDCMPFSKCCCSHDYLHVNCSFNAHFVCVTLFCLCCM